MKSLAVVGVCGCLCWLTCETALTVRELRKVPDILASEISHTREDALAEIRNLDREMVSQIAVSRSEILQRLDQLLPKIERYVGQVSLQAASISGDISSTLEETRLAVVEARGLISDTRSVQQNYVKRLDYWTDCEQNGLCWQGTLTDTLLAVRQAALETRKVAPQIAQSVEASARSVELTAQASARTAEQIAVITRPAPRWVRWLGVGLGIATPAAQVAIAAGAVRR